VLLTPAGDTVSGSVAAGWANRIDIVSAEPGWQADATVVLLRPDCRVAWAGQHTADQAGLHSALTAWFGRPGTGCPKQEAAKLDQL
jgi:hypothetical protein